MATNHGERVPRQGLKGVRVEFALTTTAGVRRSTLDLRGRHALVVIEGPAALQQNEAAKARLRAEAEVRPNLAQRLALVPVACLGSAGGGVAGAIARSVVTSYAQASGIEVWLDVDDRVPAELGLDARASSVLVLDPRGVVVWGWVGPVTPAALEDLMALLGRVAGL